MTDSPPARLPGHVAMIMDGNGRWARARGLLRLRGHEEGANSLRRITRCSRRLGIREVTFYALSAENYLRRPRSEVRFLMQLLKRYLIDERPELEENGVRLKAIGDVAALPADVQHELEETQRRTESLDGMVMRLALNYGARQELVRAVRRLVADVLEGRREREEALSLTEDGLRRYLHDPEMSDPDLVVRTAGEYRLSNFLLWQASYSELWVTDCLWPDFGVEEYQKALDAYAHRERKFGAVESNAPSS